jgi:ribA/ribD-fused uncharacterized protein
MGSNHRHYRREDVIVFRRTGDAFGGLSNMAPGFPLRVNSIAIRTAEALYQACRFPHEPEVQRLIIDQTSPMTAKMKGKPYRSRTRQDWPQVRVSIMRWCLRVKLACNYENFGHLLFATGARPIVEESRKDSFWGAQPTPEGVLVGANVLGRLLMELREELRLTSDDSLRYVVPLPIKEFILYGQSISPVATSRSRISATAPLAGARSKEMGSATPGRTSCARGMISDVHWTAEITPSKLPALYSDVLARHALSIDPAVQVTIHFHAPAGIPSSAIDQLREQLRSIGLSDRLVADVSDK